MDYIDELLRATDLLPALSEHDAQEAADHLGRLSGLNVYPRSIAAVNGRLYFLGKQSGGKRLGILAKEAVSDFSGDEGKAATGGEAYSLKLCPLTHENADALREALPFTAPRVLGLMKSAGCGDRLGLATPGHLHAVRKHSLAPILAQQSIREMMRTNRTPDEVMDDAAWGVFQEGWRDGFGADADHLKTSEDIDRCVAAGFTFFTIDPSAYVDNDADSDEMGTLNEKFEALPWERLESSEAEMRRLYVDQTFHVGDFDLTFDEETLVRAAVKYSAAVAHTAWMYTYLSGVMGNRPFELEMSVDETETPTTVHEHFFVAHELKRLGVQWVSLAPRFVGRMEKGVDYIGDPASFEPTLVQHVAIARHLGPYKLSLHSGSDKFSIYPLFARHAGDLFHLKTAGTSYLEALRAIARTNPALFREIFSFSIDHYETDKATYHVSADLSKVTHPDALRDEELASVLDQFDARQVLHVTFGSVLTASGEGGALRFKNRLLEALRENEDVHYGTLEKHFDRHLSPFDVEDMEVGDAMSATQQV